MRRRSRARLSRAIGNAGGIALAFALSLTTTPVLLFRWAPPPTTAFMLRSPSAPPDFQWVDWSEMSPHVKMAVVAAEDQKFAAHRGFDLDEILEAVGERVDRGRRRGASTISQQVAKNLFLWPEPTYLRKSLEAYFTVLIETFWSKRRILEVYLNVAEFGVGIYGVEAASRHFFSVSASGLSAEQAALLAAVLPNPRRLRVDRPTPYLLERSAWIRDQARRLGGPDYLRTL